MDEIRLFVPIAKVDDEQRIVEGVFTSEALDVQNDIVDWEATKAAVADWAKWGNIREMHQPSAVGVAKSIELDDEARQGRVAARIVDDDAWKKVKEGVYKGFSIGGQVRAAIKEASGGGQPVRRITAYALHEISLVDRPANPEAVFTVVKRADEEPPRADDPTPAGAEEALALREWAHRVAKAAGVGFEPIAWGADKILLHSQLTGAWRELTKAQADELLAAAPTEPDLAKAEWDTAYINDLPDSAFAYIEPGGLKDDEGKTVPRSKRHLPYKDKDGNIDAAHVRNALARLDQTDIPAAAKAKARRKLVAAAKKVGIEVEGEENQKAAAALDLRKAADGQLSMEEIQRAVWRRFHDEAPWWEDEPWVMVVATYADHVIVSVEDPEDGDTDYYRIPVKVGDPDGDGDLDVVLGEPEQVEARYVPIRDGEKAAAAAGAGELAKVGAKLSQASRSAIHQARDALLKLDAEAGCEECSRMDKARDPDEEGAAEKGAGARTNQEGKAEPLLKGGSLAEMQASVAAEIAKAVGERLDGVTHEVLGKVAEVSAEVGKVAAAVSALEGRVRKIEDQPEPGGPILRGAGMGFVPQLGGAGGGEATPQQLQHEIGLLDRLIAETTDPVLKQQLGYERGVKAHKLQAMLGGAMRFAG